MIFFFSATGNSKYVATRLAEATNDTIISITECVKDGRFAFSAKAGENIGFVAPTYFCGLPTVVVDFLRALRIAQPGSHYVYSVLTFGSLSGQAHRLLGRLLKDAGIALSGKFTVQMVDTWTPMFNLSDAAKNTARLDKAEEEIDTVIQRVQAHTEGDFDRRKVPLGRLYYASYPMQNKTDKFTVDATCISCGLCARQCPASAIEMQNGRPTWTKAHCAICLGCLHRCPKFSIQYGPKTRGHGQYVNPKVKL